MVVTASALLLIDVGSIPFSTYIKDFKSILNIHRSFAWRSANRSNGEGGRNVKLNLLSLGYKRCEVQWAPVNGMNTLLLLMPKQQR